MTKITLATLATATAQQVFEQVRDHLLRQRRQSTLDGGVKSTCAYRGVDGLQCAAGCLIADEEYSPRLEGSGWGSYIFPDSHRDLITQLQRIHDHKPVELWEASLRSVATKHGLAWTITLATLPTASAQEVFEQAAKHLLKQNARSLLVERRGCAYRGRDGLACAAGALLSDQDAASLRPHQNGMSWEGLIGEGIAPSAHRELIHMLQKTHDSYDPDEWRCELRRLAIVYRLDSSFMDMPLVVYVPVSDGETALA
jgi:hypothetical protein